MLEKKLSYFLKKQQFVNLATADKQGNPYSSPKILLKYKDNILYLIDYLVGKSAKNIGENKNVSVATFDIEEMKGFHVYGKIEVIPEGDEFDSLLVDWGNRQDKMAAIKVSESVAGKKNMRSMKLTFLKPIEIYKIHVESIDFVTANGVLVSDEVC